MPTGKQETPESPAPGRPTPLADACRRIAGTAKNPHLGLGNWYPAHPGDDAAYQTQTRAYHRDVLFVAEAAPCLLDAANVGRAFIQMLLNDFALDPDMKHNAEVARDIIAAAIAKGVQS